MVVCFVGSLISSGLLIVTNKNLGDFCNGILAAKVGSVEPKLFKVDIVSKTFPAFGKTEFRPAKALRLISMISRLL